MADISSLTIPITLSFAEIGLTLAHVESLAKAVDLAPHVTSWDQDGLTENEREVATSMIRVLSAALSPEDRARFYAEDGR